MSVWGDIRKRANGSEIKKEDEYLTKIENMVKDALSIQVGQPDVAPIRMFFIDVLKESEDIIRYSITLMAVIHADKTRDFCSEENVEKVMGFLDVGKIIKIV